MRRLPSFISRILLWPMYAVYEHILNNAIKDGPVPSHMGIILDGNRRFALESGFEDYFVGHEIGAEKVREFLIWCLELGLKRITLFAFSTENFMRPKDEVDHLMTLIEKKLYEFAKDEIVHGNRVKIQVIGEKNMLPESVQKAIRVAEEATVDYDDHFLYIAIAYGGRGEIIDAIRSISKRVMSGELSPEDITETTISDSLYIPGVKPIDFLIRTSGERRISNFALWQASNSLLCFLDVYWPAIRRIDLLRAIRLYQKRSRASEIVLD